MLGTLRGLEIIGTGDPHQHLITGVQTFFFGSSFKPQPIGQINLRSQTHIVKRGFSGSNKDKCPLCVSVSPERN
jgi:hypothetical protein